jgi:hypothetical protein
MRFLIIKFSLLTLVLCGCFFKSTPIPTPVPHDGGTCQSACDNGKQLSCATFANDGQDEIAGTADDELCADVCQDFIDKDVPIDRNCLAAAKDCEQYAACE